MVCLESETVISGKMAVRSISWAGRSKMSRGDNLASKTRVPSCSHLLRVIGDKLEGLFFTARDRRVPGDSSRVSSRVSYQHRDHGIGHWRGAVSTMGAAAKFSVHFRRVNNSLHFIPQREFPHSSGDPQTRTLNRSFG